MRVPENLNRNTIVDGWIAAADGSAPLTSNQGVSGVAFQRWFKFKEAFSPRLVRQVIDALPFRPAHCVDPFGGSGTTGLTCSMLGIPSTTIEVNPFLADLIESKVTPVPAASIATTAHRVVEAARNVCPPISQYFPPTFTEPGVRGRYIFSNQAFTQILALRHAIGEVADRNVQRLLKVLLGTILVPCSNVTINGKGRRYRRGWEKKTSITHNDIIDHFLGAVNVAVQDKLAFATLKQADSSVLRGDCREALSTVEPFDLALFSPPYANSFDYTDVYNLELWMLGYLSERDHNTKLRQRTMRSHVQVKWANTQIDCQSSELDRVRQELEDARKELWNSSLPDMIAYYYSDLVKVFKAIRGKLTLRGRCVVVIGDCCYAGVTVNAARIVAQLAPGCGLRVVKSDPVRAMRNSAQLGGRLELREHMISLARA